MRKLRAGFGGSQGCQTGITKEIQDAHGAFFSLDAFHDPVPVAGLFWENPNVAGASQLQLKSQRLVVHLPRFFDGFKQLPCSAVLLVFLAQNSVRFLPLCRWQGLFPDGLRFWTD